MHFIYFREREVGEERNIDQLLPLTGNGTRDLSVHEITFNQLSHVGQGEPITSYFENCFPSFLLCPLFFDMFTGEENHLFHIPLVNYHAHSSTCRMCVDQTCCCELK